MVKDNFLSLIDCSFKCTLCEPAFCLSGADLFIKTSHDDIRDSLLLHAQWIFFFFFNHNYKKNWHQPFGGASLRVNSSPLFSVKSLTCLCTVAPLMKKCHVSIAFIRLYAASWGMCAGLHYKRTQSLQGEEKQIQRTPLKSSRNLFLILTNMFNMFGCEADAVPLCRLPVSS